MCNAGKKSARPSSITPLSEPQWGLPQTEPTLAITTEAGAMGGSCQLHRLLALQPQGMENNQQTYWQVWMLLPPVLRLGKFHRLAIGEERDTQDQRLRLRVHQARQQAAVRPMEDSNT